MLHDLIGAGVGGNPLFIEVDNQSELRFAASRLCVRSKGRDRSGGLKCFVAGYLFQQGALGPVLPEESSQIVGQTESPACAPVAVAVMRKSVA